MQPAASFKIQYFSHMYTAITMHSRPFCIENKMSLLHWIALQFFMLDIESSFVSLLLKISPEFILYTVCNKKNSGRVINPWI